MLNSKAKKNIIVIKNIVSFVATYILFAATVLLTHLDKLTLTNSLVQLGSLTIMVGSVAVYLFYADKDVMEEPRKVATVCAAMYVSFLVLLGLDSFWEYGLDLAPFALCALVLSLLVSNKCGFFANFVVIMIYFLQALNFQPAAINDMDFYLIFAGVTTAVYASYVLGKHYRRIVYLYVGLFLGFITAVCRVISYFMFAETFVAAEFFIKVGLSFASGIVGIMLLFLIVPVFETIFNVVSVFRFSEIASTSAPLMRRLYEKAPGTYNHSLTVANFVESCATAIGESAMLARAAAYYHDIGKMKNPSYFSENQLDDVNPHDQITPEASVTMIKSHVYAGLALAQEYKLPVEVRRAIAEHHGTMPIRFFYMKAQKYYDGALSYDAYSYDGPKPSSKISAILMICDACEAALRSSGDRGRAVAIVNDVVEERMKFNQFSECDITMKDIDTIKTTIISTYLGIQHKRIKYPEVKI